MSKIAYVMFWMVVVAARVAAAEPDGAQIFQRACSLCHKIEAGQNDIGPSLAGVFGRKAGIVPGYNYSTAMKGSNITWSSEALDAYVTNPRVFVPGTKMPYGGLKNPAERKALIEFLRAH
jgi:cytochrome c